MKEVSTRSASLLLDAIEARGLDADAVWAGLPVSRAVLSAGSERIDWKVWVEMMARAEDACGGPAETERLFKRGAGARVKHPFVRVANAFLSLDDIYALFARWGLTRNLMMQARFERIDAARAHFTVDIAPERVGSLPTLRFVVGVLRNLPGLHGLAEAEVTMLPGATPHHAEYRLVLPPKRSARARLRGLFSLVSGASAALDELADQSMEIHAKNVLLENRLADLERASEALRERDEWLGLALDAGRVGIWRWDVGTRRLRCSAGVAKMLGLPDTDETTAEEWISAIHPHDRARVDATLREATARGEALDVEYRVVRRDTVGWVRTKGRVIVGANGRPERALGTVVDVTEQKQLEARLRFADRLISAGTLAAGVGHEINNPLAYVFGNVELLARWVRGDPALEARFGKPLADVKEGLGRIRDIVRDLRTFARPEEDHTRIVDLQEVCDAAIRIVSPVVQRRATLETEYDPQAPKVEVNESRLAQVVVNLLMNATHAMPERPVSACRIVVRTRMNGERVILEVQDNGDGIAPEVLPRIFDPFFTTKEPTVGTGLGLSICHGIVASLGGSIDVETEVGHGTTFRVTLPATRSAA